MVIKKKKIKGSTITLLVFLIVNMAVVLGFGITFKVNNDRAEERILEFYSSEIEQLLAYIDLSMDFVEMEIQRGIDDLEREEVDLILSPIVNQEVISHVALLPDGVATHISPLEGREKSIGNNILEMPERQYEVKASMELRETVVSGPYKLTSGDKSIIARKAIYIVNDNGVEEFWGIVGIALEMDVMLENLSLYTMPDLNYQYSFSATVNETERNVIEKSDEYIEGRGESRIIDLPNGYWELNIERKADNTQILSIVGIFILGSILIFFRYKTLRKKEREINEIRKEAITDNLTGLYNRSVIDIIERRQIKENGRMIVYYIDLNRFKQVNDTYGHEAGDAVLIEVAKRLQYIIRHTDVAIRMGGDEFVLILNSIYEEQGIDLFTKRVKGICEEKLLFKGIELDIEMSFGYACFPKDGKTIEKVIKVADERMYKKKEEGREKKKR